MASFETESVKVISHGGTAARKVAGALGLVTGVVAGAGFTKVALGRGDRSGRARSAGGDTEASKTQGPISAFDRDAAGAEKGLKLKTITFAERHNWRWMGRALQIQNRFGELQGSNLASAVTLQVFLALFPMMLLAAAVIGFVVSNSDTDVSARIISFMGLEGGAADSMKKTLEQATKSRKASSGIGLVTLFWSALGISAALQYAYNQAWQATGRGIKDKAVGAAWMGGAAVLLVASAGVSWLLSVLPAGLGIVSAGVAVVISFGLWLFTAKVLPNVSVSWRELIPGTILATIGLEVLKYLGGVWVPTAAASSSAVYGVVGIVLAVLAWVLLFGKLVVYSAVLNVVLYEGRHGVTESTIAVPGHANAEEMTRSGRTEQ